jgi:glycerol-3-phosphate dehydrogenase
VVSIVGGKLTTMRRMAEEVVDKSVEILRTRGFDDPVGPCLTAERPLPGGASEPSALGSSELAPEIADHLRRTYGARAGRIVTAAAESDALADRIDPELPFLWAEVVYAAKVEHAREVEDVLRRRIPLFRYARDQGLGASERAGTLLGEALGWSAERRAASVAAYRAAVALTRRWQKD